MAGRTTRTRVAASTGGKAPKAVAKKAAAPTQAKGAKAAAVRKTTAPARKAPAASAAKGKTVRGKAAQAIDSDAEEGSDESDIQTESDIGMEEAVADNTSDNESVSADVMMISDEEEDSRQEVELTPKIGRSRAANSSPPSTPKTPSPVKAGHGRAAKPKSTPAKRAKQVDSEDSEDEGISPAKKVKTVPTPVKQSFVPLPRTQTIKAQIAAERAAAEKAKKIMVDKDVQTELSSSMDRKRSNVEVVIPMRKTPGKSKNMPVKAANTAKAAKTSKAPDSGSSFFTRETDDEDKARLQRRLFIDHLPEPLRTIQDHGSSRNTTNTSFLNSGEEEDAAMEDLADNVTNKLILDVDNPDVVDEALRDTYQGLPVVRSCDALTADGSLISTVPYTQGLVNKHDVNPSALKRLATFSNDSGYVINPARFDPTKVTLSTFGQSANKVLAWKPQSGQPSRAICMTMGFVFTCNVVFPTSFGKQQSQIVKSVLFGPVRAEWERTMAFFGTVFNRSELSVSTFTVSQRYVGVNMRTFPSDPTPALPDVSFIGATPTKGASKQGQKGGAGKMPSVPSRSLLEMRDKTTWNTQDDIGVWDGTAYFKKNKKASLKFSFDEVHKLPRLETDPGFGDIVIVLYSTSSYLRDDKINLSLNLYGVVLVARAE